MNPQDSLVRWRDLRATYESYQNRIYADFKKTASEEVCPVCLTCAIVGDDICTGCRNTGHFVEPILQDYLDAFCPFWFLTYSDWFFLISQNSFSHNSLITQENRVWQYNVYNTLPPICIAIKAQDIFRDQSFLFSCIRYNAPLKDSVDLFLIYIFEDQLNPLEQFSVFQWSPGKEFTVLAMCSEDQFSERSMTYLQLLNQSLRNQLYTDMLISFESKNHASLDAVARQEYSFFKKLLSINK